MWKAMCGLKWKPIYKLYNEIQLINGVTSESGRKWLTKYNINEENENIMKMKVKKLTCHLVKTLWKKPSEEADSD